MQSEVLAGLAFVLIGDFPSHSFRKIVEASLVVIIWVTQIPRTIQRPEFITKVIHNLATLGLGIGKIAFPVRSPRIGEVSLSAAESTVGGNGLCDATHPGLRDGVHRKRRGVGR